MFTRRSGSVFLTATLLLVAADGVQAQDNSDSMSVEDAVQQALTANPRLRAARLRAEAAAERALPTGALPDPSISLGLMNRSVRGFSTDPAMAMNAIQLSQRLPWAGKREAARGSAESLAEAAVLSADEVAASLTGRVSALYYRLAYLDRAIEIMDVTVGLLRDLHEVASSRYAVGSALQQDVLSAQVTVSLLVADVEMMHERRTAAQARFNALLGRGPTEAVAPEPLPELVAVQDLESLMETAAQVRPALRAAEHRVVAAQRAQQVADRAHMPDVNVTVGYGHRPQFDDLVTLMVGFSVPVRRGSLQEPRVREAAALEESATAESLDLYNETYASLAELRAAAVRASELSQLYRTSVIPQAAAAVEAGLSAYRVGRLDFQAVLQSRMTVNQYEIESVRLAAEHHEALAAIGALTGNPSGGDS